MWKKKFLRFSPIIASASSAPPFQNKEGAANAVSELFRKELQRFFHQSQGVALRETKNISAYRSTLQKAGINPNKFMCSIEALSRRVQKSGVLPEIDPIVDLGNAISLKYLLAVGAMHLANSTRELNRSQIF